MKRLVLRSLFAASLLVSSSAFAEAPKNVPTAKAQAAQEKIPATKPPAKPAIKPETKPEAKIATAKPDAKAMGAKIKKAKPVDGKSSKVDAKPDAKSDKFDKSDKSDKSEKSDKLEKVDARIEVKLDPKPTDAKSAKPAHTPTAARPKTTKPRAK